jgi:ribosomal-protein-alanine N-acetyltransferase
MQVSIVRAWFWQIITVQQVDAHNAWSNWTMIKWLRLLLKRSVWLLRADGRVFGLVVVETSANKATITNFFVLPEFRGQGWGERLMRHALKKLPEKVSQVDLEVRVSDQRLCVFYKRFGFRRQGWLQNFYVTPSGQTESAWMMSLSVNQSWRLGQDSNLRPIP